MKRHCLSQWFRRNRLSILALAAAAVLFFCAWAWARPEKAQGISPTEYAEYEAGIITAVLADSTARDPVADGGYRGEQLMLVEVTSGQYKGETLQVYNYVGPLYGVPLSVGDGVTMIISTYADGVHTATVFEYNRIGALAVIVGLFLLTAIAVGGKTGAKSLVGLAITLACLFWVLIPGLMKGLPTLPTVFAVCAYIAVVSLVILGGVGKKTVCAMLGTIVGTALALLFGLAAQALARIDGLRISDVEPLLQIRQMGGAIHLRGLLVGGVAISALGAVMDVAMSLASSLWEVRSANPSLNRRDLFRSGMNIGRDMVGTMTNTLILAFLGSSFTFIIYLCSLGLSKYQLLSSAYLAIEIISGIASSIGVILSIPVTAFITAMLLGGEFRRGGS